MLGALAAIALVVGTITTTVAVTDQQVAAQDREPVVDVQAIQSVDTPAEADQAR